MITSLPPMTNDQQDSDDAVSPVRGVVYCVGGDARVRDAVHLACERVAAERVDCSSASDFLRKVRAEPGCAVVEDVLPDSTAIELIDDLRRKAPTLPLVFVGLRATVRSAVALMEAGAMTYIEAPVDPVLLAVRFKKAFDQDQTARTALERKREVRDRYAKLTPKELEVVRRVLDGRTNREIAADLEISVRAVEDRRSRIMRRMDADSLVNLVDLIREAESD